MFRFTHGNIEQPDPAHLRTQTIHALAHHSDVLTLNEAISNRDTVAALAGFSSVAAPDHNNVVAWRTDRFDLVDHGWRLVMRGGKLPRRRGPNRFVVWAALRDNQDGALYLIATHHSIAKADTTHKWRRPLRLAGWVETARELRTALARHPGAHCLLAGDLNTIGRVLFPPELGATEVHTPVTYGRRLRYDRIFTIGGGFRVANVRTVRTASDHLGLSCDVVQHGTVAPAPAPDPLPAPAQGRVKRRRGLNRWQRRRLRRLERIRRNPRRRLRRHQRRALRRLRRIQRRSR